MLDINVASIKTTVSFVVDKQSIAEAKKAATDLQKYFQKIADPKIRFQAQKQRRQSAREKVADAKVAPSKSVSDLKQQQRQAEKAGKAQAREAAKIAKRNETADLKFRSANLQMKGIAGKYGIDPAKQYQFSRFAKEQTELFRNGQISSQKMNYELRERIALMRREAALQAKVTASTQAQAAAIRHAKKTDYAGAAKGIKERGINGIIGGGVGLIGATAAFAGGAGVLSRIRDKGNENLDLVRKSALVKTNPNAVKALVAYGQQHGIDSASVDKVTDNFKDVRERLGESVTNSAFDQKSGKWKGGNGAIDNVMNLFGWNKKQIAQYQDNPLDFIQATVNEGQRRGMSQASIGHLIEDFGDDLAHYTDAFMNNGAQFSKTLKTLVESGQTLNDEQIKQTYAYGDLTVAMGNLMNGVDNSLFTGFMKGFADGGDDLVKNTKVITESAGMLGEGLGNLSKEITGFMGEISGVISDLNAGLRSRFPQWFTESDKPAAQALYDGAVGGSANATADWIQDKTGFDTHTVGPAIMDWLGIGGGNAGTAANQYSVNGDSLRGSAMSLSSGNAPVYTVNPTFNLNLEASVPLTIASDSSRLADYVDFTAKASQASFMQSLTLSALSGQSSTGG
ncbi:cell envelope integrity protein TolA [Klebsiella michiganensis]|uniref:cell envelope integrity protein TolA n=1 Tax=Klebsiella michiganensis TaxID=1134687 RepID=UPI00345BE9BE